MVSITRCLGQKAQNAGFGGWLVTTKLSTGTHRCQRPGTSFVLASTRSKKDTEGTVCMTSRRSKLLSFGYDLSFRLSWPTGLSIVLKMMPGSVRGKQHCPTHNHSGFDKSNTRPVDILPATLGGIKKVTLASQRGCASATAEPHALVPQPQSRTRLNEWILGNINLLSNKINKASCWMCRRSHSYWTN